MCLCVNELAEPVDNAGQTPVSAFDAWWTNDQLRRLS